MQVLASFVRVPMVVRSLVNRDCVLVWLETQFQQSFDTPNKAADEERASMLKIYETIIDHLVRLEQQRDLTPNTAEVNGDTGNTSMEEPLKSVPSWVLDIDIFVQRASFEAGKQTSISLAAMSTALTVPDPERLESLSRILQSVSSIQLPVEAFLAVFGRSETIKDPAQASRVAENLFESALNLSEDAPDFEFRLNDLQKAVAVLKRRVASSDGLLGEWVRRETRSQVFGQ